MGVVEKSVIFSLFACLKLISGYKQGLSMNFFGKFFIFASCFWLSSAALAGMDVGKQSARFCKQKLFGCSKNKTPVSMAKINQFEYRPTHSKDGIKVQKAGDDEE